MRRASSINEPTNSKEAIDLAIMRLNPLLSASSSSNLSTRFSIARSKRPVATILLPRTAYRLGETINVVVDFSPSLNSKASKQSSLANDNPNEPTHSHSSATKLESLQVPVYAILVSLETHESVAPAIAMRSAHSVLRATRKVHAQQAEGCLFARRLSFSLAIPPTATPGFDTSGVGLSWGIKVEFVTPVLQADEAPGSPVRRRGSRKNSVLEDMEETEGMLKGLDSKDEEADAMNEKASQPEEQSLVYSAPREKEWTELLEEVNADDRGKVLQGVEAIPVESFEVTVPVRVYGAVSGSKTDSDAYDLPV
jgi:hypothetical protein